MANETPKPDAKDAEIAALKAQLAAKPAALDTAALTTAIADALAAALTKANAPAHIKALRKNSDGPNGTHLVAPEHRGKHTYRIGARGHIRGNRMYAAGETITVIDERPGMDWVEVDENDKPKAKQADKKSGGRTADQSVG